MLVLAVRMRVSRIRDNRLVSVKLRAMHVPGKDNELADAISCNNLDLVFSQVPQAIRERVQIPPNSYP